MVEYEKLITWMNQPLNLALTGISLVLGLIRSYFEKRLASPWIWIPELLRLRKWMHLSLFSSFLFRKGHHVVCCLGAITAALWNTCSTFVWRAVWKITWDQVKIITLIDHQKKHFTSVGWRVKVTTLSTVNTKIIFFHCFSLFTGLIYM